MENLCGDYEENYKAELEKSIMIKIQGAFSCLLSELGSNELFKMLIKDKARVRISLEKINSDIAGSIIKAVNCGTKIISFAESSAMPDIIGEANYREFVAFPTISLFKSVENSIENSLIHICPRCSIQLERYGLIDAIGHHVENKNYIEILKDSNYKFVGHNCINRKNVDELYEIRLR